MNGNLKERGNLDRAQMVKQTTLESGQRLQDALSQALVSKGEVVDLRLTPTAAYAAVKTPENGIEAFVVPYAVDFRQPVPRALRYGVISERENPSMAQAPEAFLAQLSPAADDAATAWRQRCWAHQAGQLAQMSVLGPGDVVMLARDVEGNNGTLRPDYYGVRAADHGFVVLESLRTGRASLVHNVAGDAVKISLDADPMQRLAQYPSIVRFGMQRIASNDDNSHYILLGRTATGKMIPLAKADNAEDRDFLLQRIWEVSKLRQETLRTLDGSPLYAYMVQNGLTGAVAQQGQGKEPTVLQDMQIEVTPLAPTVEFDLDEPRF
jgi:hypothetical protein